MSKRNLFFVIIFFYNLKVLAASSYPTAIVNRVFGSNQDVGSCQSEAYVGAVEHKLAEIGAPVRLSLQYTHPYVWRNKSVEEAAKSGANITPETLRIVNQFAERRMLK